MLSRKSVQLNPTKPTIYGFNHQIAVLQQMFKKRDGVKKGVDLTVDLPTVAPREPVRDDSQEKIVKAERESPKRPRFGLLEKDLLEQPKEEGNLLMSMYVKKRLDEMAREKREGVDQTVNEILQMQKQYLTGAESKIADYDVKEIQRKLQKMAAEGIRHEINGRIGYLKDLLENEHERMEYASKKELKVMRQDRERLQRELSSKYKSQGRRHYVDNLKNQSLVSRK